MVVGELVADRYELEELVGTGGMSSVFRAHDRLLDRKVALKVLHPQFGDDDEYVERFRREARSVARLSHPNVVTVIDRGEEDGRQFIVFEYVDGENLKHVIDRSGALPIETAVALAHQIARALAFAHEHGLVHRDVKPQNVLLNGDGRAKVTDFGIARSLDVKHGVTQTGTVLGTSDYIAPEQAQGQQVSAQTDVYSLGAVLYELLTGETPYSGENFVAVAMQHINDPPPSARALRPEVPPRLDAALKRAMAKDPRDRFPSMDAFCNELAAVLHELGHRDDEDTAATVVVPPPAAAPVAAAGAPVARPRARRQARGGAPWIALLLAGVLAAAAVAAAVVAWRHEHTGSNAATGGGRAAASAPLRLTAATAWDPDGDGHEHDSEVGNATDKSGSTAWSTEQYRDAPSLGKPGVGLVLDAHRTVTLSKLGIATDTPGYTAQIKAGDSPSGPFHPVSSSQIVETNTYFTLSGAKGRYFLIWITRLGDGYDHADVNAVSAA
ncbi:MAG TPA: protein kinase [Gaiellaceae bacterium]|nr:protein kinase [Gaiellaceae bacterium]